MQLRLIKYIFGLCVLACMHIVNAQDIHFSQFYASQYNFKPCHDWHDGPDRYVLLQIIESNGHLLVTLI